MIFPGFKVLEKAGDVSGYASASRSDRDLVAGDFTAAAAKHLKASGLRNNIASSSAG
jgi:hypothetical protein